MTTTLNEIKKHIPCSEGWAKLLNHLGKTQADDDPLSLMVILESNGIDDAIWALRAVDGKDKEIRLMAADFAELVLPIYEKEYPDDDRPRKAMQAARDFANGLIDDAARSAAWSAARSAARSAADAAWAAAMSAARSAADAAMSAADAARAAAMSAAWYAADAARSAADAAMSAADADEWDKIKEIFIKYVTNA